MARHTGDISVETDAGKNVTPPVCQISAPGVSHRVPSCLDPRLLQKSLGNQAMQRMIASVTGSGRAGFLRAAAPVNTASPSGPLRREAGSRTATGNEDYETGNFSSAEIRDYHIYLQTHHTIENHPDSDEKAREVVRLWIEGSSGYVSFLSVPVRVLLIQEMLERFTGNDDERAILQLLSRTYELDRSEFRQIVEAVGEERLRDNFHGAEDDRLSALLSRSREEPLCDVSPGGVSTPNNSLTITGGQVRSDHGESGFTMNKGVEFSGTIAAGPAGCPGELYYIQNVRPFIEFAYKDGSRAVLQSEEQLLDTAAPYPHTDDQTRNAQGLISRHASDIPSISTGLIGGGSDHERYIRSLQVNHLFHMFLLFRLSGRDPVVLRMCEWAFQALARATVPEFAEGRLELSRSNSESLYRSGEATTREPNTSSNIQDATYEVDNSHRREGATGNSFADTFASLINRHIWPCEL